MISDWAIVYIWLIAKQNKKNKKNKKVKEEIEKKVKVFVIEMLILLNTIE